LAPRTGHNAEKGGGRPFLSSFGYCEDFTERGKKRKGKEEQRKKQEKKDKKKHKRGRE
jgi:hypothetical protein